MDLSRQHCFQVGRSRVCVRVGGVVKGDCERSSALCYRCFRLRKTPTLLGNIHPYVFVIEGVFVGIESTEGRVALWPGAMVVCIHGSIVLVTKSETGTWLTLAICFGALTADGFLLITLELPLTASQAILVLASVESEGAPVDQGRLTTQCATSSRWIGEEGYEAGL